MVVTCFGVRTVVFLGGLLSRRVVEINSRLWVELWRETEWDEYCLQYMFVGILDDTVVLFTYSRLPRTETSAVHWDKSRHSARFRRNRTNAAHLVDEDCFGRPFQLWGELSRAH